MANGGGEKARNEGGGSKDRSLPWRLKLMGTRRQGEGPPIMGRFLGEPSLLGEGLDRGDSIPNPALSEGRGSPGPNRASPAARASGGRGLRCCPELAGVGCCLGPPEV